MYLFTTDVIIINCVCKLQKQHFLHGTQNIQLSTKYIQKIKRKIWNVHTRSAVDVAYKIHGSSPSESSKNIIVLHGLLGSKRNWESMCKRIASANNACVVAADARNHGDSPHNSSHTYLDLASDVSQLINKLSIKKAHIIGHSMGGRTGMTLSLTEPAKVESLVVVDISPVPSISITTDFFTQLVDIMKSVNFQDADNINKARQAAKDKLLASELARNVEIFSFIIMNIGERTDKSFGWKYNLDALKNHFGNIASFPSEMAGKQYSGPVLFIGGGRSDHLPKAHEPEIKKYFPKAELKYIDNVGHNVHAENPTGFFKITNDFLSKHL